MKDIDGYVTKDDLYRLISRIKYRPDIVVDNTTCNIIIEAISDMPKADVQPLKHGRWIDRTEWFGRIGKCQYECSVCGYMREGKPQSRYDGKGGKFCDECSAKMDGDCN